MKMFGKDPPDGFSSLWLIFVNVYILFSVKLNIDDGDLVTCDRSNLNSLWTAPWSPGFYSRGIHVIKVQVEDEFGEMHVTRHVFSVDGITRNSEFPNIGQLILSLDMIAIFQVLKYCPPALMAPKALPWLCFAQLTFSL